MPFSKKEKEFVDYIIELMQSLGAIYAKAMFGGYGIFLNKLMFALVAEGTLYLKADKESEKDYINLGLGAFTYYKKEKKFKMSYYQVPEEALEDAEKMNYWASKAYAVALKNKKTKTSTL
jgi:DNA transformation protein and related proteins